MTARLIGWMGICLLSGLAPADAATWPDAGAVTSGPPAAGFDRAALQQELSQPLEKLAEQPSDALRERVQRLGDLHFALDLAVDVSPAERRTLSEQILTRVSQLGLLIRQRGTEPFPRAKSRPVPAPSPGPSPPGDLAGVLLDNLGLWLRLLGGLVIAFALGYLVRVRRAARPVGAMDRGERRQEPPIPVPVHSQPPVEGRPMTLAEIREALSSGHTVLLQMGYEIAPSHRRRFLALARKAQEMLHGIEGQTYTVWEDPGHPNRFYELLVCRQLDVLDQLASPRGALPRLAEEIEGCRVPSGFSLHRAWLGALSDGPEAPRLGPASRDSLAHQGVA